MRREGELKDDEVPSLRLGVHDVPSKREGLLEWLNLNFTQETQA